MNNHSHFLIWVSLFVVSLYVADCSGAEQNLKNRVTQLEDQVRLLKDSCKR